MRATSILLLCVAAACASAPTLDAPRPLSAPVRAAGRLLELTVSPAAVARSTERMLADAAKVGAAATDFGSAGPTLARVAAREGSRIRRLPQVAGTLGAREGNRLGRLAASPALGSLDVAGQAGRLGHELGHVPWILALDRRPLGEPDDLRHRTDPADEHPEAGLVARILRRIAP